MEQKDPKAQITFVIVPVRVTVRFENSVRAQSCPKFGENAQSAAYAKQRQNNIPNEESSAQRQRFPIFHQILTGEKNENVKGYEK